MQAFRHDTSYSQLCLGRKSLLVLLVLYAAQVYEYQPGVLFKMHR